MRRILFSFLIIFSVILSFTACGNDNTQDAEDLANELLQSVQKVDEDAEKIMLQPIRTVTPLPKSTSSAEVPFTEATVIEVIEADTLVLSVNGVEKNVRLLGLEAPKTKDPFHPTQFFAQEAFDFAVEKLSGKTVYLEQDISEKDEDGRWLFYVWLKKPNIVPATPQDVQDRMFNARLLINGFAKPAAYFPNVKYELTLQSLAKQAQEQYWGVWNDPSDPSYIPPPSQEIQPSPATQQTLSDLSKANYIGNSNSLKFHQPSCPNIAQMKEEHKIPLSSREEALNAGYVPCPICNP